MTPHKFGPLLSQFAQLGEDGAFGPDAQASGDEYSALSSHVARAEKYLADFYADNDPTREACDYMLETLLVIYRDANKIDPVVARAFANGFIFDYPGTSGTALVPRWTALAHACYGFKAVASSGNPSVVWQQSSMLVLRMNEFLDGLIGLMLVAWRCAQGKVANPLVLGNAYGSKLDEFAQLTGGENGPFYLFTRITRPVLRNALAHGDAWLDIDGGVIRFHDRQHRDAELDTGEFLLLGKLGCDLARSYIGFLSAVILLDVGDQAKLSPLAPHLLDLWGK